MLLTSADHITSTGLIKQRLNMVQSVISKSSGAMADIKLVEGDEIIIGNGKLVCITTSGHTDGCMSFYSKESNAVFVYLNNLDWRYFVNTRLLN